MAKKVCQRIPAKVRKAGRDLSTGKTKAIRSKAAGILAAHQHRYH